MSRLHTVIFFVTSRCNARCGTCFYWQELNREGDLTFDEIETLSRTMPPFRELWLSGGEPMMRRRLDAIVKGFYDRNGIRTLNLPTNGLFRDRLVEFLRFASREMPEMDVNVNVALDGFGETHDRIRGVPGNFHKALETIRAAAAVRDAHPRVRVHVNSVVTAENVDELEALGWWLWDHTDLDGQYFQVIRGDPKNPALAAVPGHRLAALYAALRPLHERYARRLAERHGGLKGRLKEFYYTRTLYFYYEIQRRNAEVSTPWPMPCTAGQTILVIDYNGDVRACELRGRIANVRDVGCDFRRVFPSEAFRRETEQIVRDQCWCTHVCFIHDSTRASGKARYVGVPLTRRAPVPEPVPAS